MRANHLVLGRFSAGLLVMSLIACEPAQSPQQAQYTEPTQPPRPVTTPYQPDTGSLLVHCGVLIDGHSDAPHEKVSVLITGGRWIGWG